MEWALLAGLLTAGLVVLYVLLRRRIDRAINASDPAQDLRDELSSVMVEINRTTEQNVILIEDRIDQLKRLMAEADKKIRLLHRENEKNDVSRQVYTNIRRKPRPAEAAPPAIDTTPQPVSPATADSDDAGLTPDRASPPESLDTRVLRLSREGFSAQDIATRLGSTVGEVELIISLNSRRH